MASSLTLPDYSKPIEAPPSPAGLSEDKAHRLEAEIVQWTDKLFDTATQDRAYERHVKDTLRWIDALDGKMWPGAARRGRNRSVLPKTERLFWDGVGLLTDLAIDFQVRLWNRLGEFNDLEKMLNDLVLHWVLGSSYPDKQYDVILYGILNTGPCKIQWNSTLAGGMGDVDMVAIAPWQWATLGAGTNPQDSECIIYFPVVTKDSLIRRFGPTAKRVQCDADYSGGALQGQFNRPKGFSAAQWAGMAQTLKISLGIKSSVTDNDDPYPMALQKEYWINDDSENLTGQTVTVGPADSKGNPRVNWAYRVEPGEKLYPRGRVIITAGGCVLEDQPNPYWHSKKPFPIYRPLRVPWKMQGQCHDDRTEVLTQRGWLKFADVAMDDLLATRQIQTGKFDWQLPIALTKETYNGDMYHFQSRSMDMLVTPEHNMLVKMLPLGLDPMARKRGCKVKRVEGVCTAAEMAEHMTHHTSIPQTSVWEGVEIGEKTFIGDVEARKRIMVAKAARVGRTGMTEKCAVALAEGMGKPLTMSGDDYCAFMGAFLAEGYTDKFRVHICQYPNSGGFTVYAKLLSRILDRPVTHSRKEFVISRKALRDHCRELGLRAWNKFIPVEIMNATPRQIKIFWDYYMIGDGSREKRKNLRWGTQDSISTSSPRMADQLMELAQKMGYSASISIRPAQDQMILGNLCHVREQHIVRLRRSQYMGVKASRQHYDGMIYCATVPNGFLYTRRNGKPTWSGNSSIRPWTQMNMIINRVLAGMQDYLDSVIEPTLVGPKGAMPAADWDALDAGASGGKIKYNNNAPKPPEFMKKAEFPIAAVQQFVAQVDRELDMNSGSSAIQQAMSKKQVPGSDSLDTILNSRSLPIRVKSRSLASFAEEGGAMVLSNMLQFYSVAHRVNILGAKGFSNSDFTPIYGQTLPAGMKPEEFVKRFSGTVRRDTILESQKESEKQTALVLAKLGKLSDRKLFQLLKPGFNYEENRKELLSEARDKLLVAAVAAAVTGKGQKGKK